jgi:cyclic-di-AMP phosphodiesterase PgpH
VSPWTTTEGADRGEERHRPWRVHGTRSGVALVVAIVTFGLFPASPAVDYPLLEIGSVAPDNVIAPVAYTVPKTEEELARERQNVARSVAPIIAYVPEALDSARADIVALERALDSVASAGPSPTTSTAIQTIANDAGLQLTLGEANYLSGPGRADAVTDAVRQAIDRWLAAGVAASGAVDSLAGVVTLRRGTPEQSVLADSVLAFGTYAARARALHPDPASPLGDAVYRKFLAATFHPTLAYDRTATDAERERLRGAVSPSRYEVRAGEKIVGAHEVVGPEEHAKMRALGDVLARRNTSTLNVNRIAGAILFNLLLVVIFGITLWVFRPQIYLALRSVLLLAMLFIGVVAAGAVIARAPETLRPELIPVAFAAVLIAILFDARIALIAAMMLAVLVGGQSEFRGTNALFLNLIGGSAAAFTMRVTRRRNQTYYTMLAIAAAYVLAAVAIGLTLARPFTEIAQSAGWGALNAVISVALAMALLPPAEEFAGIDTYFKLLEWSDLNRPLLQRLSLEAPGTYAHTMAIANLAESACNAIGANGLLARVGAYYHDIGKLKKPQYFAENQPKGRNPHDKLKPSTSAAIIKNHVREGVELAEEHRLPRAVRAFIREHHGTNPITYFLEKAKERDGIPPANSAEYVYPGPVPQSAETAIVMLADGVEASTRVLNEPTPERVREVIERIVRQRIEQGQLRDAPLTMRQIETVKEQFARVLTGMYHNRIDYPASAGGITAETAAV